MLPALVFGVPALAGHAVLPGDDMTQNFPLRVLAGREIRSGHLPLFDAYAWGGTPLLAGWNAGAAYPLTWLFAVLPGVAAWTAGLIVTWATAGTGLFCFLRALRLRSLPAFLGALSFALAGAMSAQVTHFSLVAGMSWVPLALLAVLRLSEPSRTDRGFCAPPGKPWPPREQLRWTAVLAAAVGLMILAGEPRAIVDGCVAIGLYAVWRAWRCWRARRSWRSALPAAALIAGGCVLGAGLGAVQWLPGLAAISTSQRGNGSMALFSSGSLPPRWLLLTLVPDLLGGSGSLSQPGFFADYNLTEVTSYVGILPLVGALALLARAFVTRGPDGRRRVPEWLIWHGQAAVGILLALGGNSPLGRVLYHLPLFGSQRLQSRNILVLDLALAILLAYWLDKPFPQRAHLGRSVSARAGRMELAAALLAPAGILVLVVLALTWGAGLLRWLGTGASESAGVIGRLNPWIAPYAVLAAGAIALVIFGRRLGRRWWARACAAFVVTDVVVFTILGVVSVAPSGPAPAPEHAPAAAPAAAAASAVAPASAAVPASAVTAAVTSAAHALGAAASAAQPISGLGYQGRFAIYDPDLLDTADLSVLGPPDVNDMTIGGMPSVQGYSSIVDGSYASATGSHSATGEGQNVLAPAAVGNGVLDTLDTTLLLTLPEYLTTTAGDDYPPGGPPGTGRRSVAAGQHATWYLGESVAVSRVTVPDSDARQDAAAGAQIGLTSPDGQTQWFPARAADASALEISLARPVTATAVLGQAGAFSQAGGTPRLLGAPSVSLASGRVLVADGQLQNALVPPRWSTAGFDGGFAVFTDRFATGPLTVQPLSGQPGPGRPGSGHSAVAAPLAGGTGAAASVADASVRYITGVAETVTTATVSSPHGVRLVRSVAAIPGWSATWQPRNGQPVTLSVLRDGLVQAVDVPPGMGTVTWHYTSPGFTAGLAVSATATLVTLVLAVVGRRQRGAASSAAQRRLEPQAA